MSNQVVYKNSRSIESEKYIIDEMLVELARARSRYPSWPSDLIHATVVVQEESGEILKAANEVYWGHKDTTIEDVRKEVIQTMAMCLRLLTETPGLAAGTVAATNEPILDWDKALRHLNSVHEHYMDLIGKPGVNVSFVLTITFAPLADRYNAGERTSKLYSEMMAVE